MRGRLSRKDARQVLAFARQRQPELLEAGEKARRDEPLSPIDPPTRVQSPVCPHPSAAKERKRKIRMGYGCQPTTIYH